MKEKNYSRMRMVALLFLMAIVSGISSRIQAQTQVIVGCFSYTLEDGEATLASVVKDVDSNLKIDASITYEDQTYPITKIAAMAFAGRPIQTVELGANIRILDSFVFAYGPLKSIKFNDKLETISTDCFIGCAQLSEISLPASVKEISSTAFKGCTTLTKISIADANPYFTTLDNAIVSKNKEVLWVVVPSLAVDSVYAVPSGIKELAPDVFYTAPLKQVILPESLRKIGARAFGMSNIKTLTIPPGVTEIGEGFAYGTNDLQNIIIAEGNKNFEIKESLFIDKVNNIILAVTSPYMGTDLNIPEGIRKIGDYTFTKAANLKTVNVPASVSELGEQAFASCPQLETVKLQEGIVKLGRLCLFNNKKLVNINYPSTLREMDVQCLASCNGLTKFILPEGLEILEQGALCSNPSVTEVYLPKSLKKLGTSMFSSNISLEKVNLPEWLEEIPEYTFTNCSSLTSLYIPDGVKEIGAMAFFGVGLTSVELPAALEIIDNNAFHKSKLQEIVIPDKVTTIRYNAFGWNADLKSVKLGKSVKTIEYWAFNTCTSLENIELNEDLESIEKWAFMVTTNLKQIKLPSTLKELGEEVFKNSGLKDVYAYMEHPTPITDLVFSKEDNGELTSNCPQMTLHVVDNSLESYKKAPVWSTFGTILGDLSGVEDLAVDDVNVTVLDIYDLQGTRHDNFVKGVNIVRYSNGKMGKVMK